MLQQCIPLLNAKTSNHIWKLDPCIMLTCGNQVHSGAVSGEFGDGTGVDRTSFIDIF